MFTSFKKEIEMLIECLLGYQDYLDSQNKKIYTKNSQTLKKVWPIQKRAAWKKSCEIKGGGPEVAVVSDNGKIFNNNNSGKFVLLIQKFTWIVL